MPERTTYEPGTPSWVDLGTTDPDAAKRFYGELFGWVAEDAGPVEETGGYAMFTLNGKRVAGVGPLQGEAPSAWPTSISTADLGALEERAKAAGAIALMGPMDVMDAGRLAVFMHEAVGVIGAWQPGSHFGAEIVNEPGSFTWSELQTRDVPGAKAFGEAVFGWKPTDQDMGEMTYTLLNVGDRGVAGAMPMQPDIPDQVPANWAAYFAVDDTDATLAKVAELGGSAVTEAMDIPEVGRFAIASDPQGAMFAVIQNAQPTT